MDLRKYKPTKLDDRRKQEGTTTLKQAAGIAWDMVKDGAKPEAFATGAKILFGSKLNPDDARKSIKTPDVKLRRPRTALAGNDR